MSRYDGLIIPRSYSEYINKTDAATLQQALQLSGVLSGVVDAGDNKAVKSGAVATALASIMASSTTLSGATISAGSVVRVLFTAEIAGDDASTGLTLTYNGNDYAVKVGKNGALAAFVASEISSGVFKYLQAYTTLELIFDGSQFVIMGNPVVISNADLSIMADGSITYHDHISAGKTGYLIIGDILINYGVVMTDRDSFVLLPHGYSNTNYTLIGYNSADLSPVRGNKFESGFGTSIPNNICNYIAIGKI